MTVVPTAADAVLVALGAAAGAPLRYVVHRVAREHWGAPPAAGTLAVNVAGSFVLGLLLGGGSGPRWVALVGTGFCGALTTFSTLALEVWEALDDGPRWHAVANVAASVFLGIGAAALGWWLASA